MSHPPPPPRDREKGSVWFLSASSKSISWEVQGRVVSRRREGKGKGSTEKAQCPHKGVPSPLQPSWRRQEKQGERAQEGKHCRHGMPVCVLKKGQ